MTVDARRADIISAIQAETGIDEEMIRTLVHGFYGRVGQDPLLAPVFEVHIVDWNGHLDRMCEFWSSVALMSGRYHGRPMPKHAPKSTLAISIAGSTFLKPPRATCARRLRRAISSNAPGGSRRVWSRGSRRQAARPCPGEADCTGPNWTRWCAMRPGPPPEFRRRDKRAQGLISFLHP